MRKSSIIAFSGIAFFLTPFIVSYLFKSGILLPFGFIGIILIIIGLFFDQKEKE